MKRAVWLFPLFLIISGFSTGKPAWKLFRDNGKAVKYEKMIRELSDADMVFFGELHNNPISHWLELEIALDLHHIAGDNLVLGAEMFETDNQLILDEYLQDLVTAARFEEEAKIWKNYRTDYRPLVEFARTRGLAFAATNIPRRYASLVAGGGFEALDELSAEALGYIAPLPVPYDPGLACYRNMLEMGHGGGRMSEHFPKAQAIKDATMAHFILQYFSPGKKVFHFNGSYHSENHEGIVWYLNTYHPGLKILTIATVLQKDINTLEETHLGKADFIVVVPENMTTTY